MGDPPEGLTRVRRLSFWPRGANGEGWIINPETQWGTYLGYVTSLEMSVEGPHRWTVENIILDVKMPIVELWDAWKERERQRQQVPQSEPAQRPEPMQQETPRPDPLPQRTRTPPCKRYYGKWRQTARKSTIRRAQPLKITPPKDRSTERIPTFQPVSKGKGKQIMEVESDPSKESVGSV